MKYFGLKFTYKLNHIRCRLQVFLLINLFLSTHMHLYLTHNIFSFISIMSIFNLEICILVIIQYEIYFSTDIYTDSQNTYPYSNS